MGSIKKSNGQGVNLSAEEKMTKVRRNFTLDSPFFASIFLPLEIREEEKEEMLWPTICTDGTSIIYNRKFVEGLALDVLEGIMVHEVMHIVCMHHLRKGSRDPIIWNMATDFAINPAVIDSGFVLPENVLLHSRYQGLNVETIYKMLLQENKQTLKQMIDNYLKEKDGKGGGAACGWIIDKKNPDGSELTPGQKAVAEKEQAIANIQAAMAHEKMCGKLPGVLARILGELVEAKVNWKEALAQFVETNSKADYSWTLPNNRFIAGNIYLPRVYKLGIGTIVNLIDASGSVSPKELDEEVSELKGILSAYEGVVLQAIFFDTKATEPHEITEDSDIKGLKLPNLGGGTDYRPPFRKIEEAELDPVCVVCLTDGCCNQFPKTPDYPVLWILIQKNPEFKPPFGTTIVMNLSGE